MNELECAYFLSTRYGFGQKILEKLQASFGSMTAVCQASGEMLRKQGGLREQRVEQILDKDEREKSMARFAAMTGEGIGYQSYFCGPYPDRLRSIYRPPKHLFFRGKLPETNRRSLAIVGARDCSYYGRDMARMFAYRLAEAGMVIISGMARGIDGWSHQGALESGGDTLAVLGCGVDICYPAEHKKLYDSIGKRGGLISEYPPGTRARPMFFPMRNRIISGLSDGILVVEAKERSGSLITAEAALEQGKDVFVIPGRVGDDLSIGCNRLIRQGATLVMSPRDILEHYGMGAATRKEESSLKETLLGKIGGVPVSLQQLQKETNTSAVSVLRQVATLQQERKIREVYRGHFIRNE